MKKLALVLGMVACVGAPGAQAAGAPALNLVSVVGSLGLPVGSILTGVVPTALPVVMGVVNGVEPLVGGLGLPVGSILTGVVPTALPVVMGVVNAAGPVVGDLHLPVGSILTGVVPTALPLLGSLGL